VPDNPSISGGQTTAFTAPGRRALVPSARGGLPGDRPLWTELVRLLRSRYGASDEVREPLCEELMQLAIVADGADDHFAVVPSDVLAAMRDVIAAAEGLHRAYTMNAGRCAEQADCYAAARGRLDALRRSQAGDPCSAPFDRSLVTHDDGAERCPMPPISSDGGAVPYTHRCLACGQIRWSVPAYGADGHAGDEAGLVECLRIAERRALARGLRALSSDPLPCHLRHSAPRAFLVPRR